jgi:hypothetical protein
LRVRAVDFGAVGGRIMAPPTMENYHPIKIINNFNSIRKMHPPVIM